MCIMLVEPRVTMESASMEVVDGLGPIQYKDDILAV